MIVFGVASVVSILAVGEGASHAVQEQIRSLGPDRILLFSKPPQGLQASDDRLDYGLKNVDLQRIEQLIPELRSLAPSYELDKEIHIGARTVLAPLVCTTPSFQDIHQLHLAREFGLERGEGGVGLAAQAHQAVVRPHGPEQQDGGGDPGEERRRHRHRRKRKRPTAFDGGAPSLVKPLGLLAGGSVLGRLGRMAVGGRFYAEEVEITRGAL